VSKRRGKKGRSQVENYARDPLQLRWGKNEWRCLVVCMLLNQTTRVQVEPMVERFFELWPTPEALAEADIERLRDELKPLGFSSQRSQRLVDMSFDYIQNGYRSGLPMDTIDVLQLPGCGFYAADAHCLFIRGEVPESKPDDPVLQRYMELTG
jgi:endonuclease III